MSEEEEIERRPTFEDLDLPGDQITLLAQTFESQEELVRGSVNIPRHLLQRSVDRRKALGLPTRGEVIEKEHNQTNLDKRLSGIIDLASEPCSLLAEHIATQTAKRMDYACSEVRRHSSLYQNDFIGRITGIARGFVVAKPDDQPVASDYYFVRLAENIEGDSRIESLDLVAAVKLGTHEYKKRFRKYTETYYQITSPNQKYVDAVNKYGYRGYIGHEYDNDFHFPPSQAYVVANTRGNIAIPLFGITTERTRPDCSFVNVLDSNADISEEVLVGRDEIEDRSVREESFKELLRILTDDSGQRRRMDEAEAKRKAFEVVKYSAPELIADLGKLAVIDHINSVIGPANETEDKIIEYAQYSLANSKSDKEEVTLRKRRTIEVNGISYEGVMEITVHNESNAQMRIDTEITLPGAPTLPSQDIFPDVRIYRASNHPVRFDGIEIGSDQHKEMSAEFCELIGKTTE